MSYLGSKLASGAYQAIIAAMPPHDTYIETHLGGGAVMARKPPSACSIGIDLDQRALTSFKAGYPVSLVRADAVAILDSLDYEGLGRTLVYADPPYLHETRTSNKRYRFEYTRQDHVRLIECLRRVPASVILSGYPSRLYDELLDDWRTIEFQVMTRGGVRTEKLWLNYPLNSSFSAAYAGRDFTDRQRIKRKAARWADSFKALPPAERTAVFAALLQSLAS